MIGNKIRVNATPRFGHKALSKGHQGQLILTINFMFIRLEFSKNLPYLTYLIVQTHIYIRDPIS